MKHLLLVGAGRFGQKYLSTLTDPLNSFSSKITVKIATRHNWRQLIEEQPDGVMICTPPDSHVEIALLALQRNIPVMVEKPLALSLTEAQTLQGYSAPILINHLNLFSYRYQVIKQQINPAQIRLLETIGTGSHVTTNCSWLYDYAPHDLSMILDLMQQLPSSLECQEITTNFFRLSLTFQHCTTFSLVGCNSHRMATLQIRDTANNFWQYNGTAVCLEDRPLTNSLGVFIDAIDGKPDYRLGLDLSLQIIRMLEIVSTNLGIKQHFQ
jgi:hypothetical protein